jgi:mRNA interferase MazF
MEMKRGDVVTVAIPGDFGKPRPAVVVQTNLLNDGHASIVVCPFTSTVIDSPLFRVIVEPTVRNGLEVRSHVMVDKLASVRRPKIGPTIGVLDPETMIAIDRALAFVLAMD